CAMVRPLRTSHAHQPIVPMPTPTSWTTSKLRQYSANSALAALIPADQAKACMYKPSAMNRIEKPTHARMHVRQPPHQSVGPYLGRSAARCTATDVVAIPLDPFRVQVFLCVS